MFQHAQLELYAYWTIIIEHKEPHNHCSDYEKTMELNFKETLRRRARKTDNCEILKNIYNKSLEDFKEIASTTIKPYKSYKDLMARAQKEGTPNVPKSFEEMNASLLDRRYGKGNELGNYERS